MPQVTATSGTRVLLAAACVAAVLGTVHAFSVFLIPVELQFNASRSAVSLTYSLALVALTVAVLFGPKLYARVSASTFLQSACLLAAAGAVIASLAGTLWMVWLGYSLIFGVANGLGYGFGLQIAAQVHPGREGYAMGVVTAAYALGAVLSPALFQVAVDVGGFSGAMAGLALVLACTGVLAGGVLRSSGCRFHAPPTTRTESTRQGRDQSLLWLGYFGGTLSGLMVIGHAAGLLQAAQSEIPAWVAPVMLALCNLLGSLTGGRLADRMHLGKLLGLLAAMTGAALAALSVIGGAWPTLLLLGIIGFAYGGTIAAYPAAVAKLFGMADSARIYGRVFTAWGCAGLLGPWIAGALYDLSGDYRGALQLAALTAVVSIGAVAILFARRAGATP